MGGARLEAVIHLRGCVTVQEERTRALKSGGDGDWGGVKRVQRLERQAWVTH